MAAEFARCTFFVRYKEAGVSFALYQLTEGLAAIAPQVDRLAQSWLSLLGVGVELPYVRVSFEKIRGDVLFLKKRYITIIAGNQPVPPGWVGVKGSTGGDPDFRDVSVQINWSSSTVERGRTFMRYQPDSMWTNPNGLEIDPNWDNSFEKMLKLMKADQWRIKATASDVTRPPHPVLRVESLVIGGPLQVTTSEPHLMAQGHTVRLGKVEGTPSVNGVHKVTGPVTATTFFLQGTTGTGVLIGQKGYARHLETVYPLIHDANPSRVTTRKAGRPFGSPVGRRRKPKA